MPCVVAVDLVVYYEYIVKFSRKNRDLEGEHQLT